MDTEHEIVNLRAVALGPVLDLSARELPRGDGNPVAAKLRDHELWMGGQTHAAVIYDRAKLRAGDKIKGPAIIIEMDSTTLVHTQHVAEVDHVGNILITPEG
jgi:N-methylhydantoinase A